MPGLRLSPRPAWKLENIVPGLELPVSMFESQSPNSQRWAEESRPRGSPEGNTQLACSRSSLSEFSGRSETAPENHHGQRPRTRWPGTECSRSMGSLYPHVRGTGGHKGFQFPELKWTSVYSFIGHLFSLGCKPMESSIASGYSRLCPQTCLAWNGYSLHSTNRYQAASVCSTPCATEGRQTRCLPGASSLPLLSSEQL